MLPQNSPNLTWLDRLTLSSRPTRILRNLFFDLRFGRFLGGLQKTKYAHLGANDTANTDYSALSLIFQGRIRPQDVLVDVGCGKGRVINWWLSQNLRNQIVGLELDADVAAETAKRLSKYKNVAIIPGDAIKNLPAAGTIFYLFNPFEAIVVGAFKNRLFELYAKTRSLTVLYYNPAHADIFKGDPEWTVEEISLGSSPLLHKLAVIGMRQS